VLNHKVGDAVKKGDTLLTVYSNQEDITKVEQLIRDNYLIGDHAETLNLIHEIITD